MSPESIAPNDVHVWLMWHRDAPLSVDELLDRLSVDEQMRAARFLNERAKREFCLTRYALRSLLGRYGIGDPDEIEFAYGEHGKPRLAADHKSVDSRLQFNVAHTRHLSAFAFAHNDSVGVDVEFRRAVNDADRIVEGKFAKEEREVYSSAAADARKELFFRGWTRKEAFIKATGEGLCRSLESFAVTIHDEDTTSFLRIDDDALSKWSLFSLAIGHDHSGAIAIRNSDATVTTREWRFP